MHGRGDDHPGVESQAAAVLRDHQRPIGRRRLQPEPEEVHRCDEDDRVGQPQAGVGHDGGTMFGTISRRDDRARALAARDRRLDEARTDCSSVAERTTRAIRGVCTTATAMTSVALLVPAPVTSTRMKSSAGNDDEHIDAAHQERRRRVPPVAGGEPDRRAGDDRRAGSPCRRARARCGRPRACARAHRARARRCRGECHGRGSANGRPIVCAGGWGAKDGPNERDQQHEGQEHEPDRARGRGRETEPAHRAAVRSLGTSSTTSRSAIRC